MQESFWWWQCSDKYIISLSPPTSIPPFSPSLISRTVSVDVKHHVYLLTYVLGSLSLTVLKVSVDVKQHWTGTPFSSKARLWPKDMVLTATLSLTINDTLKQLSLPRCPSECRSDSGGDTAVLGIQSPSFHTGLLSVKHQGSYSSFPTSRDLLVPTSTSLKTTLTTLFPSLGISR